MLSRGLWRWNHGAHTSPVVDTDHVPLCVHRVTSAKPWRRVGGDHCRARRWPSTYFSVVQAIVSPPRGTRNRGSLIAVDTGSGVCQVLDSGPATYIVSLGGRHPVFRGTLRPHKVGESIRPGLRLALQPRSPRCGPRVTLSWRATPDDSDGVPALRGPSPREGIPCPLWAALPAPSTRRPPCHPSPASMPIHIRWKLEA